MKNYNIQSYLPLFEGFYNSNEDAKIDNDIEMDIDYYLEEHNKKISFDQYNFSDMYKDFAKDNITPIVEKYLIDLELIDLELIESITYENLVSPTEYNFSTDSINCTYNFNTVNKNAIQLYIAKNFKAFKAYINNRYTSYDGFISSYSNDGDKWMLDDDMLTHKHKTGTIFDFILHNEDLRDDYIQEIYESDFYVGNYMTEQ